MILLAFNSCGPQAFYWLKIQLCKIKAEVAEMRGAWPAESLVVFSSADKNIRLENSTELSVSGKMYDIAKTEIRNGVKFYYATSDDDEDAYVIKLVHSEQKASHETSIPVNTLKLFDAIFFACGDDNNFNFYPAIQMSDEGALDAPRFHPPDFKEIFSPPPNASFS